MTSGTLDALIDDYLDGRLSRQQQDAFERDLLADPQALDRLIAAASIHGLLQDRFAAESQDGLHTLLDAVGVDESDADGSSVMDLVVDQALAERRKHELADQASRQLAQQQAEQDRENRFRIRRANQTTSNEPVVLSKLAVVLAFAAMLGLIAWLGWPEAKPTDSGGQLTQQGPTHQSPDTPSAPNVAFIRSSADARWVGLAYDSNRGLAQGKTVTLRAGLAEVVFSDGAAVIVQGPATFEPTGTNAIRLDAGRIVATVPAAAHGFAVETAGGLITDYGTEFGVIVNADGQTLAQTFTGQIGLTPIGGGTEVRLFAGDAVVASPRGRVRDVTPDALAFVRRAEFAARLDAATADAADPYQRWLVYSYALRRDPGVVLYYTFDPADVSGRTLRNTAAGHAPRRYDASFAADPTAPGRFSEKPAFALSDDGDYVEAVLDRAMPAATLAGWYWVDKMDGKFASLLHTSGTGNTGGVHWHLNTNHGDGWSVEFVQNRTRHPQLGYWYDALSEGWSPQSLTGRWVHLALCYDTVAGEARLYVDGQEAARSQVEDGVPVKLGDFRLGNWYAPPTDRTQDWPRPLRGRIDEFVVLERALSGAEVAAMYEAGRPDN